MPSLNHYLSGRSRQARIPSLGGTLPPNIERRVWVGPLQRLQGRAPYRGWDAAGRVYLIAKEGKMWVARSNGTGDPSRTFLANTLVALGSLLMEQKGR